MFQAGAPKLTVTPIDKFCFASDSKAKYYFQINKFNGKTFFGFCKEREVLIDKLNGNKTFNMPMDLWAWFIDGIDRLLTIAPRNETSMFSLFK